MRRHFLIHPVALNTAGYPYFLRRECALCLVTPLVLLVVPPAVVVLQLENLEARAMLAVDILGVSVHADDQRRRQCHAQRTTQPAAGAERFAVVLDASDTSTIVTDGSGNVEQWLDKSGLGNHAAQSTAGARPTRNASAILTKPSLRFDGVDDGLVISDNLVVNRPYTVFVVDQYYGGSNGRTLQSRDPGVNWLISKWKRRQRVLR